MSNDVFGFGLSSTAEVVALDWPLDVHCPSSRERERERDRDDLCVIFILDLGLERLALFFSFLFFVFFLFGNHLSSEPGDVPIS